MLKRKPPSLLLKMLMIASIDAIATQLYLDVFTGGFRISMSVILLPIFLYYNKEINPIIQAMLIMTLGMVMRSVLGIPEAGTFLNSLMIEYPTFIFDLSYGIIYYFLFYKSQNQHLTRWFAVIVFNDFFSNCLELVFRSGQLDNDVISAVPVLLTVASIRATVAITTVMVLKYYKLLLKKEEHDERYKNLLMLTADLNGEVYLMNRNIQHIEDVMNQAYELYETTSEKEGLVSTLSLNIAKDVHEIKKNYIQVIKGLETITGESPNFQFMKLKDLLSMIEHYADLQTKLLGHVVFDIKIKTDFYVRNHFLLMSVLRNLISNSFEAVKTNAEATVQVEAYKKEDALFIRIKDNGRGIKDKDIPHIFDPGFSTKFNDLTGDISRGVGLTLVRDIVSKTFFGTIEVTSEIGYGTMFTLKLPLDYVEVKPYEILYR